MTLRRKRFMLVCPNRKKRRKEWEGELHSSLEAFDHDRRKWENLKKLWDQETCALCGAELEEVIR